MALDYAEDGTVSASVDAAGLFGLANLRRRHSARAGDVPSARAERSTGADDKRFASFWERTYPDVRRSCEAAIRSTHGPTIQDRASYAPNHERGEG